eukprot:TRINITY_DN176_c0_g1_i1.p1 TRINITY_DN176_c0_g1~~TRINITY_DN176_c0_g1_i1.p1  ORF type:complete len:446 (+),score=39.18 TRINITY_DN176_c0_g1_i1:308-1645(+)
MHRSVLFLFSLLVCIVIGTNAQTLDQSKLSFLSIDPGVRWWPLIMAASYNNTGTNIDLANIVYTWSFPGEADQSCTYRGTPGVQPCRGNVIEKTWLHTTLVSAVLTASIPGYPAVTYSKQFNIQASWTGTTSRRENVLNMSIDRWNTYRDACLELKANGIWDHLVYHHQVAGTTGIRMGSNRNAAHRGPALLPWHRVFLRILERAIGEVSGDLTIGIPYWDWTVDSALPDGPMSSALWTDTYIGPNGNSSNSRVTSGPFCSQPSSTCDGAWPLLSQLNGPYLERELGMLSSTLPTATQIANIMTVKKYDGTTMDDRATASTSFRQALEGWAGGTKYGGAHNLVHMFVGGSMNPLTSPNDPVFFLHHANVDRIWYNWQINTSCYGNCYVPHTGDGNVTSSTPAAKYVNGQWRLPGHEWESRLFPWYLHPYDVADQTNSALGWTYVQ